MDENQNKEESIKIREEKPMSCANYPIMKGFLLGLLIFLGTFCAFYVVADWHLKSIIYPNQMLPLSPEHFIKKEIASMDNMARKETKLLQKSGNILHLQQVGNEYKIYINLRAFENNENNVQVSANGNILTIAGRTIRRSKNNEQISEFQQNYLFGDNVKLNALTKETEGNYYIVTIPISTDSHED